MISSRAWRGIMSQNSNPLSKDSDWSPYSLSLPDQVYLKIKDLIFRQQLVPGQKLQHEYLSQKLGVSTTPVREAINRLVQEGYVKSVARKGYYLNEITIDEAEELYSFRELIEVYTAEMAARDADESLILDLKKNVERYQESVEAPISMERLRIDEQFHLRIAEACNNRFIKAALERIFERLILKRSLEGFPQRGKVVHNEHETMLDCFIKHNPDKAKELMRQHIHEGRENFILYLRKRRDEPGT
jgi:DNA-binding GntR family transcriptional regulator